jgi:hypothetical protein
VAVLAEESVTVQRTGEILSGLVDPREHRLYLPEATDVVPGDVAAFRGYTRRIAVLPELWWGAGLVAEFEPGPAYLPDLGRLLRASSSAPVVDEESGIITPPDADLVWSGACKVEPTESDGSTPLLGEQRLGRIPFVVTVPLALTDVQAGDIFDVTSSRDGLLVSRNLTVTGFRMSSTAETRELLAFDIQE